MTVSLSSATLIALLLASIRVAAWLVVCPPFNGKAIPGTVKALLSVAIVLPLVPRLATRVPAAGSWELVGSAVQQVVIGAALGFVTALLLAAVQAAGELLDVTGGFAMAVSFDPMAFSGNTAVIGRFYATMATTLLFVTNGHELVVRGFTMSYQAIPLDAGLSLAGLDRVLTAGMSTMFLSTLQIAGPLVAVLFCADLGLGLLSKIAPALNAFALGFPAKILLTLTLLGFAIVLLPRAVAHLVEQATSIVTGLTAR